MPDFAAWVSEQKRVYFDNAGMAREYRTQLRGIKAPILLCGYVGLLVFIAILSYWGMSSFGTQSISELQRQLSGFFTAIIAMLEFMVGLVAPVLAASSIIGEYQRQSIDLLFSSPMTPKYFLVGKVLASYRYVLLLLSLSIPVAAMCVVLGGATWSDVLGTYILVSLHGLVYMAISLPIAVMTARPVSAVAWSYAGGILYFIVVAVLTVPAMMGMGSQASPLIGMSPATAVPAGAMTTEILGMTMPIWAPALILTLVFLRLMILGAASALTQAGSKETFNLRLTGVLLCLIVPLITGAAGGSATRAAFGPSGAELANIVWVRALPILIVLPYLSTWAGSGGAKTWPNGWWKTKFILRGTPASGLPYLMLLLAALTIGAIVGTASAGIVHPASFVYEFGVFAAWAFAWSIGWVASSVTWRTGIESCRRLHVLFLFMVYVLPGFVLMILESVSKAQGWGLTAGWTQQLNLFAFLADNLNVASVKVVIITVLAIGLWYYAEQRRKGALESMRSVV